MARRFQNLVDIRRYLASLINRVESGDMEAGIAGKLGFLANSLGKIIEGCSLEERVEKIEKKMEVRR
jgi:hypothetical protein